MLRDNRGQASLVVGIVAIIVVVIAIVALLASIEVIGAGEVGVVDTFGKVSSVPLGPGISFKAPWSSVHAFSTKVQQMDSPNIVALTGKGEGQSVGIHAVIYYYVDKDAAPKVYTELGDWTGFVNTKSRGAIYEVVGRYSAEDLYTNRDAIAGPARERLNSELEKYGIHCESITISSVDLPEQLKNAIQAKQAMQQDIQKKDYEVQVASREAERKRVEAQGIADANDIIARKLTKEYLEWYWIEQIGAGDNTIYVTDGSGLPTLVKGV